jgi:hypothetical protein
MLTHKLHLWEGIAFHFGRNGWLNCRSRSSIVTMERSCSGTARTPEKRPGLREFLHRANQKRPLCASKVCKSANSSPVSVHDFPEPYTFQANRSWTIAPSWRQLQALSNNPVWNATGRLPFRMAQSPMRKSWWIAVARALSAIGRSSGAFAARSCVWTRPRSNCITCCGFCIRATPYTSSLARTENLSLAQLALRAKKARPQREGGGGGGGGRGPGSCRCAIRNDGIGLYRGEFPAVLESLLAGRSSVERDSKTNQFLVSPNIRKPISLEKRASRERLIS